MNRARPMPARLKNNNKARVDYEPRSAHSRAVNKCCRNLSNENKRRLSLTSMLIPNFHFMISMRTISSITREDISRNLWLLFWQMKESLN